LLLAAHGHPDTICFLAHQAVEKTLKALLSERSGTAPRVHDLELLLSQVQAAGPGIALVREDAIFLAPFSIEARYPTLLPVQRTRDDATRAVQIAEGLLPEAAPHAS
jgi:HEPN domain-containing protein